MCSVPDSRVLNLEDILLQAKVLKPRNRLGILHGIVPCALRYNSNEYWLRGMHREFNSSCMPEVRLERERPDCVIHAGLKTDLLLSPGYPIENLLLCVCGLREQGES